MLNHNAVCVCKDRYYGDPFQQCSLTRKFFYIFKGSVHLYPMMLITDLQRYFLEALYQKCKDIKLTCAFILQEDKEE